MTISAWQKAQKWEAKWWRDKGQGSVNSYHEEFKQWLYAEQVGIKHDEWCRIDLGGKSVLDVGGGPVSLLLKTHNAGRRKVIDPLDMPSWAVERYKDAGIELEKTPAEDMNESGWDEVWIYNTLQHVQDPAKVIQKVKSAGKIVRVFEFLDRPANEGHPHVLTQEMLDKEFGCTGTVTQLPSPIVGNVYFGVFDYGVAPMEFVELHWVNTGTEFPYPYYLAVMSSLKTQKAAKFNLWLVKEPSGKYFDAIKDKVTLHYVNEDIPGFAALKDKSPDFQAAHLVDYYRMKVMYENGGVYADLDGLSVSDYCTFIKEHLSGSKEFLVGLVSQPHVLHAGLFACKKGSTIAKKVLDEAYKKLNNTTDFKWGSSGPDILNAVCSADLDKVYETEYGMLGGNIELYQLFKDNGKLPDNQRYIHLWANSINGYWPGITEGYIENSDHLYAKLVRQVLTKDELHPQKKVAMHTWLSERRERYRSLYSLLKSRDCHNIMEIGVFDGKNAVLMIEAAAKRVPEDKISYFGFDVFDKLTPQMAELEYDHTPVPAMEVVQEYVKNYTKASVNLYPGLTKETLPQKVKSLPKMDLIFIDGGHSIETIRNDWKYARQLMKPDTVVVFDDYYPDVPFVGCRFILSELDSKYQYEVMPEVDNHTAPWGPLKVQVLCVRSKSVLPSPILPVVKPALHVLGLAHTKTTKEYSACAYTQKVFKLCKMMKALGYDVYHYGAEGSNPDCTEHIDVVSDAIQLKTYGGYDWKKEMFKHDPTDLAYRTFDENAIREVNKRKGPKDLLLISMGNYQKPIFDKVGMMGVEMGVGYTGVFTDKRVFESYAWMHYIYGMMYPNSGGCDGSFYDVVIPNYYDPEDFEFCDKKDDYYLYMGRLIGRKGVHIAAQCCERIGARLVIAGQGTEETVRACGVDPKKVEFVGYADVKMRSELMKKAKAVFVPTLYLEPFGGVNVEAMFCGTPAITTDWGGFRETVQHGKTGYRCRTMDDFCWAAKNVDKLDLNYIREYAVNNYSLQRVSLMYDEYFMKLMDLWKSGWYELHPERKQLDWLRRY
jgi:hypothetical protein